jgi:ABC-type lipoprotein export system ATPase subunit
MGMDDMAGRFPGVLSGGERQRVAIARALINRPTLVLADEPTGNLDRDAGEAITSLFLDLAREASVMLILVTHNRQVAAKLARRMELRDGVLQPWEADEA